MKKNKLQTAFSTRQYMLSKDFEVYYYCDQPISSVGPHTHDYFEFYFFIEGNISIYVEDREYPIKPGDFVLIPPGISHYPKFHDKTTSYHRFILWLSNDYCLRLQEASSDYLYLMHHVAATKNYLFTIDSINFNQIQSQLFLLIEEVKGNRFGRVSQISLQVNSLLLFLNRIIHEKEENTRETNAPSLLISICDYINTHLIDDLSLDCLAKEFFLSKFYLSHSFKSEMGISIHQYILKKRLHTCKDAILSGMSISKTYELYGFHDYSSFFRSFKKEYGVSPKEYRDLNS